MHLDLPESSLDSLKHFVRHYLMIVLSILTALGLEQLIVSVHERHAAEQASSRIEQEIRSNLADVRNARTADEAQAKMLGEVRAMVVDAFNAHEADSQIAARIIQASHAHGFNLNLQWPTLRHEAWDVAVADQSASWIDAGRMWRYSTAYASQRDAATGMASNITLLLDGPRLIDTLTDLRTGTVDPRTFVRVVSQMTIMLEQSQQNLAELQKQLEAALAHPMA